jgi:hypothetical protein
MRFIAMVVTASEPGPAASLAKSEPFAAMQRYNEAAVKAGVLLAAEGLTPPSQGVRVEFDRGKRTVVDGPFAETKELVAGFSIIKASSMAEAVEWVKRAPYVSTKGRAVVEIRRLMDTEDFGEGFTPNEEIAKVKFR